ncbi:hypothetical protein RDI58_013500 [Solanum bulbocastanum]|uniref:Uncharacterized protein n=1 Tax=Solanum bulbocastanum TaxID=147425 RepID=A0AAN8YE72_SOLBU
MKDETQLLKVEANAREKQISSSTIFLLSSRWIVTCHILTIVKNKHMLEYAFDKLLFLLDGCSLIGAGFHYLFSSLQLLCLVFQFQGCSWRSTTYKNNNVTDKFKHALQCAKIYNYDLPQDIENLSTLLFVVFCVGI